jgi:signal transduction histidine kinase
VNAQLDPQPRLEQLAQALSGRFSLAIQDASVATEVTGWTGSLGFFRELGAERTAIERLATALGTSDPAISVLQTANAQRSSAVRLGGNDLSVAKAYNAYDGLITTLLNGIDHQLDASASDARTHAFVYSTITLAALLAAILLALVVSRLLLNPIRKVREGALAVANEQLPDAVARIRAGGDPGPIEPIEITTDVEVGQVAQAVDDLHRQAVILASREAELRSQVSEMFVTLSRRHNSLINQQLDLIETLEKDEEDSGRLESLFRLDHLAARMRRTAESLLILADAPPARAAMKDDLTVSAALQAATAGVQEYERVQIGSTDGSHIRDAAAADVIHLFTELVDNALAYSSPETTVSLESFATPDGVAVEIADAGLGIAPDSLAELNEILRSGGEVTPESARRMGVLVVSRLAQRHGITVLLLSNQRGGTTARVILPASVLDKVPDVADWRPPVSHVLPGQRRPATAPDELGLDVPAAKTAGAIAAGVGGSPRSENSDVRTPIFRSVQSAWLSAGGNAAWLATEVEPGWDRADQVARSGADTQVSATGLPVRQPGNRLVPGSVTKPAMVTARDPDAIRARLAAHARGVSRGRRAAAASPDQTPTEVGPS